MIKRTKLNIRVLNYLTAGRCMLCKQWFSREQRGIALRAGRIYEVLCMRDAQKLAARYGKRL
jgi:hypothetical protein